jgi:hypothetical protein
LTVAPHNGTATSKAAAKVAETTAEAKRGRMLAFYRLAEHRGMTDDEMEQATGFAGNTIRPRRGELIELQAVSETRWKRPTRTGCMATVYVAKEFA